LYAAVVLLLAALVFGVSEMVLLAVFVVTGKHGWLTASQWEIRGLYIAAGLTAVAVLFRLWRRDRAA
jgi:hypothetical protein